MEERDGWRNGLMCSLVVASAILVAHPVAEMGFIDDFSYVKTAQVFAQTGHVVYNGWATAMLGWLIPWGALFIKVFGFSFTVVRSCMLPVAMAVVALFHASLRRFGIGSREAAVGALTLGLSPLFVPMASSYMTDVPGLLVIVLNLYLCQRALSARSSRRAVLWIVCAAVTNVAGGTVRQIAWLGALVMTPAAGFLLRERKGVRLATALISVCSVAGVVACMRWFARQPFALREAIIQGPVSVKMVAHMGTEVLKALLCLLLVLLPITVSWAGVAKGMPAKVRVRIVVILAMLGLVSVVLARKGSLEHRVMPWLGHVIGTLSIFPSTGEMLGTRPVTLTIPVRVFLSLVVVASALVLGEHMRTRPWRVRGEMAGSMREALWLVGPFSAGYVALLLPRALYSFIYDRYLLGLMPGAIVLLLLVHRRWVSERLSLASVGVLAIFGLYSVAGTHDWFALNRARAEAVALVYRSGVPLRAIQGGFDHDGWTQIEAAGYINDERIRRPAGAYRAPQLNSGLAAACRLPFAVFTPAIHAEYFVVFEPMSCLRPSRFAPVRYRTWLPPFERSISIERAP